MPLCGEVQMISHEEEARENYEADPPRTSLLRLMVMSRRLDEICGGLLREGMVVPHYHSGRGQEALMVASVMPLRTPDTLIYTHRGYGHLMAKGVSVLEIFCDLFNKRGGTNDGFGGVMHVSRPEIGVPGREGVFGTRFGIAVGMALANVLLESEDVVACFYGEAAGARGQLYESLNMAVLWKLPVVFVAENNGWSFSSRTEWLYPEARMTRVWRGFDIPVWEVDGNDAIAIWRTMAKAVDRARKGEGPSVIEGLTYRLDPHIWYDDALYQDEKELASWLARDPIEKLERQLVERGMTQHELGSIELDAKAEVDTAFEEAKAAADAEWPAGERGYVDLGPMGETL
jgi:TPP-dependent pyruvate/acetoin dehydrogenase alpha subunit